MFSGAIASLEQGMEIANKRQHVVANNIANVHTPHYKSKSVRFTDILNNETQKLHAYRTDERHFSFGTEGKSAYQVISQQGTMVQHNGNNVDLDYEMSKMAQNQIWYHGMVDRFNGSVNSIRTVINEGR